MKISCKKYILCVTLLTVITALGQEAIHNFGNLQLHKNGSLGFHASFINDGSFDQNKGLTGFYSNRDPLYISGAFSPEFYDFEIGVENNLYVDVSVNITNSLYFIFGNYTSDKEKKNQSLNFDEQVIVEGLSNFSKIDGYASWRNEKIVLFPVGNKDFLKPVTILFTDEIFYAKAAYFDENANFPQSFATGFNTDDKVPGLGIINPQEFWNVTTSGMIQLTLSWESSTHISSFTDAMENIVISGWNKEKQHWDNLGNAHLEGDLNDGKVTSNIFNANDYEIFTHGFQLSLNTNKPGNYAITPNGDGINDYFTLDILKNSPNNEFQVFNRAGQKVYEKSNYIDEFHGRGNTSQFNGNSYLEEGVYFYLLELKDINQQYQGYFYLVIE